MAKIGFIGLGNMGLPMAVNLVKAGHCVCGFDLDNNALSQFLQRGGLIASTLSEVASNQDIIITMLQNGQQVLQVCSSEDGLFRHACAKSLYIDCSTIDVQTTQKIHQLAKEKQIDALDAPVSGGIQGAEAATLTFIVGGEESIFKRAYPILSNMGKRLIHAGPNGNGQAAKICNNMILGISMIAISEAFVLAEHLGLCAEKLFEVVTHSSGQCWAMSNYVPVPGILANVPANNNYKTGFAAQMMLKDLLLSQKSAQDVNLKTPLAANATALYEDFVNEGFGQMDFSGIMQPLKRSSKEANTPDLRRPTGQKL